MHQGNRTGATAAKQKSVDRDPFGIFPVTCNCRALSRRSGKTRIRMRNFFSFWTFIACRCGARHAVPINDCSFSGIADTLPPHVAVFGQTTVGENGVFLDRVHGILVREIRCPWCYAEEPRFRIDSVQAAVLSEFHPRDVIAYGLDLPSRKGRDHHSQIRFATCRGKRRTNVLGLSSRVGDFKDEHVLCKPPFVSCEY